MRKIIVTNAIIILALVLSGCGHGNLSSKKSNVTTPRAAGQTTKDVQQQSNTKDSTTTPADNSVDQSTDKSTSNSASTPTTPTTENAEIIAKSTNIMSSSEKEELLNQVDKELDSLFNSINSLEDAPDADLNLNQ